MKAVLLHAALAENAPADELDVLDEAALFRDTLNRLGHEVTYLPVTMDLGGVQNELLRLRPDFAVNLVETLGGTGHFCHFIPALLEHMALPYSGCPAHAIYITTHKGLTKEQLAAASLPTPPWTARWQDIRFDPPYIIKPVGEDASIGLDESAIVREKAGLESAFHEQSSRFGTCMIEAFVEGREFNISMLAGPDGPEVLPAAEMLFQDFPPDMPHMVGYAAKWDAESFEFSHTIRCFDFPEADGKLLGQLRDISGRCWDLFKLQGYARVDFRVDNWGRPWILEINANPCISPDAGFTAAAVRSGLSPEQVVDRIIRDLVRR